MNFKVLYLIPFIVLCIGCSSKPNEPGPSAVMAASGSSAGNGSDNPAFGEGAAWFLGNARAISYCYELNPAFGASAAEVERALNSGFSRWADYIQTVKVQMHNPFANVDITFPTIAQRLPSCTGTEDVKFYFGGMNDEVSRAKAQYENPTAFSVRTAYDPVAGWGKGFVWVAPRLSVFPDQGFPNWSDENVLQAILLHEIGHVYGNGHVAGTIMDENLSWLIAFNVPSLGISTATYNRIDQRRLLIPCFTCALQFTGSLAGPNEELGAEARDTFEFFSGRVAHGSIQASLATDHLDKGLTITVKDDLGTVEIPVSMEEPSSPKESRIQSATFEDSVPAFKAYRDLPGKSVFTMAMTAKSYVLYGSARSASGQPVGIILEVNSEALWDANCAPSLAPIGVKYFREGKLHSLFLGLVADAG